MKNRYTSYLEMLVCSAPGCARCSDRATHYVWWENSKYGPYCERHADEFVAGR